MQYNLIYVEQKMKKKILHKIFYISRSNVCWERIDLFSELWARYFFSHSRVSLTDDQVQKWYFPMIYKLKCTHITRVVLMTIKDIQEKACEMLYFGWSVNIAYLKKEFEKICWCHNGKNEYSRLQITFITAITIIIIRP